ncbi:MAG: DMT family transporter [Microscillaceae bacterium]|nr:DMT family transporter [Microscillaceae bacterium]
MPHLKDYLLLHFIVLIWGFTAILGLLIQIPAVEMVFYRTLIAAVLLLWLLYARRKSLRLPWQEILKLLGTGVFIATHWILFFASAKVSNASVCLAGMTTASLWVSFLEPLFHRRKVRFYEIFLAMIIILGLYVIFRFEFNHFLGLALALLSAFWVAVFSVINSLLVRRHNHYVITFYEMTGACLSIVLFFPIYVPYLSENHTLQLMPGLMDWVYLLILAGICTVYAYSTGVKLMTKFSAYAINLTVNLEPVYGIILAFLIFGEKEKMTGGFYLGTLIILAAVGMYPLLKRYSESTKMKFFKTKKLQSL